MGIELEETQPIEFIYTDRETDNPKSLSFHMNNFAKETEENNKRLNQTIHGSSFWECPHKMLLQAYGTPFTDYTFNWSNQQAARAGDSIHIQIQKELVDTGLAIKVPDFSDDDDVRTKARRLGMLVPAIEVNLNKYLVPFTARQKSIYKKLGIIVPGDDVYDELTLHRLGIRIDSIIQLPNYGFDMPCEIKTVKPELWEGGKNHRYFADKMYHYICQLQMQMHFIRDSKTGERPEWGMIYVINRADTSKRIERYVKYNPEFIAYWLPKIKEIAEAWAKGEMLEPRPSKSDCGFCPYYSRCPSTEKEPHIARFVSIALEKKARKKREENEPIY